jgi:hypothetical protein
MTRARQPKPTAPPLAVTLRSALAQGWHTLDALEAMAPGAPSTRRARVHAALEELRLAGMVREERFARGVAEVRELPPVADGATCPACKAVVREHDDHHAWCAVGIRDCSWWAGRAGAAGPHEVVIVSPPAAVRAALTCPKCGEIHEEDHCLRFATLQPTPAPAAPAPPVGQSAPVEPPREPTDPHFVECRRCKADPGHPCKGDGAPHAERAVDAEAWARVQDGLPPAPKGPGPSSRCAVCDRPYARHADAAGVPYTGPEGHPFTPKPRGRPRGPIVAVDGGRVERSRADVLDALTDPYRVEVDPALATEASMRAEAERQKAATHDARVEAIEGVAAARASAAAADPETSRGGSEETPSGAAQGFADTLRKAFPDAFKPEIIDGADVATVAREMVDLTIAFSPVVARRDSIDAVGVTPLDNGRFRVDALWESTGLPMEVDAPALAVMRARYLLLRGLLTRSLSAMDFDTHRAVVRRFFQGVEPWAPAPGSPLARMGAGPITMAVPDGVGIEAIDWTALMGALAGEDGTVPDVVPVRPLGPPLPPAPPPEPPAAHVLEGEHSRACGYWKVHDPAHCDPAKLAAEIKICRACWGKMYALGGGRPRVEDRREYVGDRYV